MLVFGSCRIFGTNLYRVSYSYSYFSRMAPFTLYICTKIPISVHILYMYTGHNE